MTKSTKKNQTVKPNGPQEQEGSKMQKSQLMKLFEDGLKDIYWAEKALTKALPKMVKNATSEDLVEALDNHLAETQQQVTRLEDVFATIGKKPVAKKCPAMEGLIKEGEEMMDETEKGVMCDAGIIAAAQKVEHYEIASYGTLSAWADILNLPDVVELLQQTILEEKAADEKLTGVAMDAINFDAAAQTEVA